MNRAEHVEWVKKRGLEELDAGSPQGAIASVMSDLTKHPETQGHAAIELMMVLALNGHMASDRQIREFIQGIQ